MPDRQFAVTPPATSSQDTWPANAELCSDALAVAAGPVRGADALGGFGADKVIITAGALKSVEEKLK